MAYRNTAVAAVRQSYWDMGPSLLGQSARSCVAPKRKCSSSSGLMRCYCLPCLVATHIQSCKVRWRSHADTQYVNGSRVDPLSGTMRMNVAETPQMESSRFRQSSRCCREIAVQPRGSAVWVVTFTQGSKTRTLIGQRGRRGSSHGA